MNQELNLEIVADIAITRANVLQKDLIIREAFIEQLKQKVQELEEEINQLKAPK